MSMRRVFRAAGIDESTGYKALAGDRPRRAGFEQRLRSVFDEIGRGVFEVSVDTPKEPAKGPHEGGMDAAMRMRLRAWVNGGRDE